MKVKIGDEKKNMQQMEEMVEILNGDREREWEKDRL